METYAAFGILGVVMSALAFWAAWYVIILIARWRVFDKAGIAGWKSLIPFYSDYCTYKISWKMTVFWCLFALTCVSGLLSGRISTLTENGEAVPAILIILSTIAGFVVAVINLVMNIKLAQRFGHGVLFGLGLTFLTPLFTLILGLGSSEYYGNPEEGLPPRRISYY
jgi:uncharacterized membrane protein